MWIRYLPAGVAIVLDQLTKLWADSSLVLHQPIAVMPSFNLTLMYNEGAAFSFLSDAGGWQRWFFSGLALLISVVLVVWIKRLKSNETWTIWALSLILGGAVGNLIDRLVYGHVVDFVQWYYGSFYWPAFNIADAAITIGTVILLASAFLESDTAKEDASHS